MERHSKPEPAISGFAVVLRKARKRAGLTQAVLGKRASVSVRTIEHLEAGRGRPYRQTAGRLADALGLTAEGCAEFMAAARPAPHSLAEPLPAALDGVPLPLSSFVGRDHEFAELNRLLGNNRLLTLTGPGGVGKTRLAFELSRAVGAEYADGVAVAHLAAVATPSLVPQAVADARTRATGLPLVESLAHGLESRSVLLILDNCEHVIDACARLLVVLLESCRDLHVIATSREPLQIPGETMWRVPPLGSDEAKRLFVERAQAACPTACLNATEYGASDIVEICRRLDGLPLAIELAAAWVPVLTPREIVGRLNDGLSF